MDAVGGTVFGAPLVYKGKISGRIKLGLRNTQDMSQANVELLLRLWKTWNEQGEVAVIALTSGTQISSGCPSGLSRHPR